MRQLLFLLCLPLWVWSTVDKPGDFQIWQRNFIIKHFAEKWSAWAISELRWGDDASEFYSALLQAQLYYRLFPWLVIGPGYQQVWTREPPAISWKLQYLPLWDAIFRFRFAGWEIQDRNRIQYLIYGSDPSHWLYRNRFRVIFPPFIQNPRLSLFADNEFFWLERRGVPEDRLSAGLMIQWQDNWGGELFYMSRFLDGSSGWIQMNVLTGSLLFSF